MGARKKRYMDNLVNTDKAAIIIFLQHTLINEPIFFTCMAMGF